MAPTCTCRPVRIQFQRRVRSRPPFLPPFTGEVSSADHARDGGGNSSPVYGGGVERARARRTGHSSPAQRGRRIGAQAPRRRGQFLPCEAGEVDWRASAETEGAASSQKSDFKVPPPRSGEGDRGTRWRGQSSPFAAKQRYVCISPFPILLKRANENTTETARPRSPRAIGCSGARFCTAAGRACHSIGHSAGQSHRRLCRAAWRGRSAVAGRCVVRERL